MGQLPAPEIIERLQSYSVLDTGRETVFDRFVFTAAQMFRVPMSYLSFQEHDRCMVKASVGLKLVNMPGDAALCDVLTQSDEVLVVEDASHDVRFKDNTLVTGKPFVRFFAGAPLIAPGGLHVGCLCVMDTVPKTLLARQVWQLSQLAESVVVALEARRPAVDRP